MDSLYSVTCRLGMDATGFTSGAALALGVLQKLEQQAIAAGASTASLGKSLGLVAGGMALIAGGMAGVGVMTSWATAAGQMQESLVQLGITATGTRAQLQSLYSQSFAVANATQFSAPQVMDMEQIMARMGFRDLTGKQTQREVIGASIDQFARAAEIAQHFQKTNYTETVTALAQQAHMFGNYSGLALAQNVAWATGVGLMSHTTAAQEVNVLRYMAPAVKSGQLTPQEALTLVALGNQTGLTVGGRAASSIGTLIRELSPNGLPKHDKALAEIEKMGGGQFYQHGKLVDPSVWLGILNRFYDATRNNQPLQTYLARNGLLVQGSQAASVLGSDASIKLFGADRSQLVKDTPEWQKSVQGSLNMTLPGQLTTLSGNVGSIRTLLGAQLLPAIGPVVHGLVELTGGIVNVLRLHPGIAQFVVTFTAVATAAALIAGPVLVAAGAFGILSAAGVVTAGSFLPFTATVLGIIAAVSLVSLAVTHWSTAMDALTGKLGLAWQVLSVGAVAIGGFVAGMKLASAAQVAFTFATTVLNGVVGLATVAYGALDTVVMALSGGFGIAAIASGALDLAIGATSAVAGMATGAMGLLDGVMAVLTGGFGLAAVAAGLLDLALSPITLIVAGLAAGALAAYYAWTHWAEVSDALTGKLGPVWQGVASLVSVLDPALPLIGLLSQAFHNWGSIMGAIGGTIRTLTTDFAKLIALMPSIPTLLEKGVLHLLPGGDQLAQMLGLGGTSGGAPAGTPATSAHPIVTHHAAAIHQATHATHHSAVVHNHHAIVQRHAPVAHHPAAAHGARGSAGGGAPHTTINLHVAAGAVVNHIAPGHGHDPKTIADEVTKRTGEALGHHMANALRTSGLLPSTTRPTLHQLGTP